MKMQTGKRLIFIKGGKESWHFQIYSDGTEKWRLLLQQPADQHAAQETSRRKSLQPAGQPAAQEISRRRNPRPADQPEEKPAACGSGLRRRGQIICPVYGGDSRQAGPAGNLYS